MKIVNKRKSACFFPYAGSSKRGVQLHAGATSPDIPWGKLMSPAMQRDLKLGRISVLLTPTDRAALRGAIPDEIFAMTGTGDPETTPVPAPAPAPAAPEKDSDEPDLVVTAEGATTPGADDVPTEDPLAGASLAGGSEDGSSEEGDGGAGEAGEGNADEPVDDAGDSAGSGDGADPVDGDDVPVDTETGKGTEEVTDEVTETPENEGDTADGTSDSEDSGEGSGGEPADASGNEGGEGSSEGGDGEAAETPVAETYTKGKWRKKAALLSEAVKRGLEVDPSTKPQVIRAALVADDAK